MRFAEVLAQMGARIAHRRELDRGAAVERRDCRQVAARRRFQPHSRCGDDGRDGRAVRRWPEHAAQHRQLAREGNRPHGRDGDRTAQAGRARWRRAPTSLRITPPAALAPASHRHLRRPPHGHVLLARRRSAACVFASTIPECVAQDFSGRISTCLPRFPGGLAHDGRRARSSRSTGRRLRARAPSPIASRAPGLSLSWTAARCTGSSALSPHASMGSTWTIRHRLPRSRVGSTWSSRQGVIVLEGRRRHRRHSHRGGRRGCLTGRRPSAGARSAARTPARVSASRRVWWPTVATWARWFFPTPASRYSSRPAAEERARQAL